LFALILTLFVIPALYSFLSSKKRSVSFEELIEAKEETAVKEKLETV
jgi:hypothetical protein